MSDEGAATEAAQGNGAAEIDPSQVDANELAKNMAQATDEQLAELMSGPMRGQILAEIFRRMSEHFRAEAAGDTEAVIHWRIGGAPDGGTTDYETVIRNGTCEVHEGFEEENARVTFRIGGADFLRLVTGNAAGPMLFMSGKLRIEGDMMFAANAASLFVIPKG
jgi:putative sterol carrier protein